MGIRRALLAAGVVIVVLLVVLLRKSSDDKPPPPPAEVTHDQVAVPSEAPPAPLAQPELPAPPELAQPQPQPVPLPAGEQAPPLDGKRSQPAPPQKPFTPDEVIAKREADLKLLDDTKARLEDELAAARKTNDATTVHDLEIRIARLTDVRKKRSDELAKLRAGGSAQP